MALGGLWLGDVCGLWHYHVCYSGTLTEYVLEIANAVSDIVFVCLYHRINLLFIFQSLWHCSPLPDGVYELGFFILGCGSNSSDCKCWHLKVVAHIWKAIFLILKRICSFQFKMADDDERLSYYQIQSIYAKLLHLLFSTRHIAY